MQTFGSFLVATLVASLASAASIPPAHSGSFTVERTPNPKFTGRNGPLALARAYAKYGVAVPENVRKAALGQNTKRASGSATATPVSDDAEYLVTVKIGTPAQSLSLDFDTGSSDLWVFSSESGDVGSHDIYNIDQSSTAQQLSGDSWSISYGDGSSASGDVYTDVVKVGPLSVSNQAVESATQVSSEFTQDSSDGLLGLAFSSINTVTPDQQQTWFDNVSPQLDSALFVADLKHDAAGSYTFGAIPSKVGQVYYADVDNSQGFWQFDTSTSFGDITTIADTGTTLLLTDDSIVSAYYKKVKGAKNSQSDGGYVFPCSASLPAFTFTVGDGTISVPGSLINYAPVSEGSSSCFGGIQSAGDIGQSIFGDIALKAAYVVFNGETNQVGWAQKV